jgi:hypothetical protein
MQDAGRRRLDSRESLLYGGKGRGVCFMGQRGAPITKTDRHQRHNDTNEMTKEKSPSSH